MATRRTPRTPSAARLGALADSDFEDAADALEWLETFDRTTCWVSFDGKGRWVCQYHGRTWRDREPRKGA